MNRNLSMPRAALTRPIPDGPVGPAALSDPDAGRAAAGGGLDTYGVNPSALTKRGSVEAYRERLRLRGFLWLVTSDKAVAACGRCRQRRKGSDEPQPVVVKVGPQGVGLSGLQRCAKVWVCPVCSVAVWGERSMEIGLAAAGHVQAGGRVLFVTLTTRHHVGDSLAGLVGFLRAGWIAFLDSRGGQAMRASLGVIGHVRVMEVNYGDNGWHPHYHLALFVRGDVTQELAESVVGDGFDRWSRAVVRAGGKVPLSQAQDVRLFGSQDADELGKYLTKTLLQSARMRGHEDAARGDSGTRAEAIGQALGKELTQAQRKRARKFYGTLPARALLLAACDDGDADALDLWREYERATHRVRGISWSRDLRKLYGLGVERSEQEIVDDDRGGVPVMVLTNRGLARLIGWPELLADMAQAYRDGDYDGLRKCMDTNGIGYEEIDHGQGD